MRSHRSPLLPVFLFATALQACGGMAMNQGRMAEENSDTAREANAPLAIGGSIQPEIQLDLQGTATPSLTLISARPSVVEAKNGRLFGRSPGVSAILVTTKEGVVLDFYHLWVEAASRATLHRLRDSGEDLGEVRGGIDLLVGESVYLTPKVYFEAQELGGVVPGEWSVSSRVAGILKEGMPARRRLVARTPGAGTLSVKVANITIEVPIQVVAVDATEAPSRPPSDVPPPPPAPPTPEAANSGGAS